MGFGMTFNFSECIILLNVNFFNLLGLQFFLFESVSPILFINLHHLSLLVLYVFLHISLSVVVVEELVKGEKFVSFLERNKGHIVDLVVLVHNIHFES